MEAKNINDISAVTSALDSLSEYEFDQTVQDYSEYGRAYLSRNMPTNFDVSSLENMNLFDFGQGILAHKQGEITSYGALSGKGQALYSALTVQPEQQLEDDLEEDIEEDFEIEMGGISL